MYSVKYIELGENIREFSLSFAQNNEERIVNKTLK